MQVTDHRLMRSQLFWLESRCFWSFVTAFSGANGRWYYHVWPTNNIAPWCRQIICPWSSAQNQLMAQLPVTQDVLFVIFLGWQSRVVIAVVAVVAVLIWIFFLLLLLLLFLGVTSCCSWNGTWGDHRPRFWNSWFHLQDRQPFNTNACDDGKVPSRQWPAVTILVWDACGEKACYTRSRRPGDSSNGWANVMLLTSVGDSKLGSQRKWQLPRTWKWKRFSFTETWPSKYARNTWPFRMKCSTCCKGAEMSTVGILWCNWGRFV